MATILVDEEDVAKILSILPDVSVAEAINLLAKNGNNFERALAEAISGVLNAFPENHAPHSSSSSPSSSSQNDSSSSARSADPWSMKLEAAMGKATVVEVFVSDESEIQTPVVQEILNFFQERPALSVDKESIQVFSGTGNSEVRCYVESFKKSARIYPLIRVHGNPIGDLHTLREIEERGELESLISYVPPRTFIVSVEDEDGHLPPQEQQQETPENDQQEEKGDLDSDTSLHTGPKKGTALKKTPTGLYYGQTLLDSAMEFAGGAISALAWAPIGLTSWVFGSTPTGHQMGPNDIAFAVVHTNWLWCGLKRKLVVSDKGFLRLNPNGDDVLSSHDFQTIKAIVPFSESYFGVYYSDSSFADYFSALPADCNLIIETIISRSLALGHPITFGSKTSPSPTPVQQDTPTTTSQ
eukprot:TRINITY_DN271_c0_g2_i1.p1 TRINITY_DN271_c0_g2~~TRINITY_DN271_c0_g2_i1.p1  ORF type:complete len:413 (+),score=187.30 TRINITY_DN271_c0_g2_i1:139-1377(+)